MLFIDVAAQRLSARWGQCYIAHRTGVWSVRGGQTQSQVPAAHPRTKCRVQGTKSGDRAGSAPNAEPEGRDRSGRAVAVRIKTRDEDCVPGAEQSSGVLEADQD